MNVTGDDLFGYGRRAPSVDDLDVDVSAIYTPMTLALDAVHELLSDRMTCPKELLKSLPPSDHLKSLLSRACQSGLSALEQTLYTLYAVQALCDILYRLMHDAIRGYSPGSPSSSDAFAHATGATQHLEHAMAQQLVIFRRECGRAYHTLDASTRAWVRTGRAAAAYSRVPPRLARAWCDIYQRAEGGPPVGLVVAAVLPAHAREVARTLQGVHEQLERVNAFVAQCEVHARTPHPVLALPLEEDERLWRVRFDWKADLKGLIRSYAREARRSEKVAECQLEIREVLVEEQD
ncbi:hypothetical protein OBBRIDRAFT_806053 [Obba rivulosa]|uniref:Uncharacterized protein n=1 Tax=Obba rivulosa TaxID=1052685 RepID=A0A8E2AQC0_9APHY|nr:hypothetical protein OBBRIDRAFT_806053 [Obba rivulosa]